MGTVVITPDPTFREWRQALALAQRPPQWYIVLISTLQILFGVGLGATLVETMTSSLGVWPSLALISAVVYYVLGPALRGLQLQRFYVPIKQNPTTYAFSFENVLAESLNFKSITSWNSFDRFLNTKSSYIIILRTLAFICIPKRNIPDEQKGEFIALLQNKLIPETKGR